MIRHARAGLRLMVVLLLGLASEAPAHAGAPAVVWLELPECATPPYDTRELLRTLELELGSHQLRLRVQRPIPRASSARSAGFIRSRGISTVV